MDSDEFLIKGRVWLLVGGIILFLFGSAIHPILIIVGIVAIILAIIGFRKNKKKNDKSQMKKNKIENEKREAQLKMIKEGKFPPVILQGVDLSGLKPKEKVLWGEGTSMSEPRAIRNTAGIHFRGVWVSRGESHQELREICSGTLVLTDKRLIFLSNLRTSNIELTKIVNITTYDDGIMIHAENKQKPQFFSVSDPELWSAYLSKIQGKKIATQ